MLRVQREAFEKRKRKNAGACFAILDTDLARILINLCLMFEFVRGIEL